MIQYKQLDRGKRVNRKLVTGVLTLNDSDKKCLLNVLKGTNIYRYRRVTSPYMAIDKKSRQVIVNLMKALDDD